MLRLLDVSNFWSPTGGGVRRYQLEKVAALQDDPDVRYMLVVPSDQRRTERRGNAVIEHVPSSVLPGSGSYRQILSRRFLRPLVEQHDPDVIECGSPWIMPSLVRGLSPRAAVVGFWHADFPRAHFQRNAARLHLRLGAPAEKLGWLWARRSYGRFDAICCASELVAQNIVRHGLRTVFLTPLGVHTDVFHPARRNGSMVERFQGGDARRLVLVFPHRFNEEKGLSIVLEAHSMLAARMGVVPAMVFVGLGSGEAQVEQHARTHPHVHVLGFQESPEALAEIVASSDVALCLSAYETFGLSTAEAMACGTCVVAANEGAAAELVSLSGGGRTVARDAAALAKGIEGIGIDRARAGFGARGREHIQDATWARAFANQLRAYRLIAAAKAEGRRLPAGIQRLEPVGERDLGRDGPAKRWP